CGAGRERAWRQGGQRLRRVGGGPRRPHRHGGARGRRRPRSGGAASAHHRAPAGICAAAVRAHQGRDGRHRHVQAEEGRPRAPGVRPRRPPRSDLLQRPVDPVLHPARQGSLRSHPGRPGARLMPAASPVSPADVVAFWQAAGPDKWFVEDDVLDAAIRERFLAIYEDAAAGGLTSWEASPEGALALLIVLDQFPRNMFRGSARTYAADPQARAVAERALARGFDGKVDPALRTFFYLPFMHSESAADQERCVALYRALGDA